MSHKATCSEEVHAFANEMFDNFEKSAIFALFLKQLSSSSFHVYIC